MLLGDPSFREEHKGEMTSRSGLAGQAVSPQHRRFPGEILRESSQHSAVIIGQLHSNPQVGVMWGHLIVSPPQQAGSSSRSRSSEAGSSEREAGGSSWTPPSPVLGLGPQAVPIMG